MKGLDQFYTGDKLATIFLKHVQSILPFAEYDILLEPSAGTGSLYKLLDDRRIGIDLDPKCRGIKKQNFYHFVPAACKRILTIGNPPFGKNASDAVKFFNHAAQFSEAIAFVLPRTFRKASIINRLDQYFHQIFDETVEPNSFIKDGKPYDVWTVMQIWVRRSELRKKIHISNFADAKAWWQRVSSRRCRFLYTTCR